MQFKVDGANVGSPVTLNAGKATYSTSSLAVGDRSITAEYSGATGTSAATAFGASTSTALVQKVNSATVDTTTSLASSANPSVYGDAVTFTVTVAAASGSNTPTGTVQFKIGSTNVGSPVTLNDSSKATYSAPSLAVGSHSVTAEYSGATGFNASTSMALSQRVDKANQTVSFATDTPTTKKYSDADFTVSATATSGSDVSFAAKENSTCSVSSSGTVSSLRVGDCIIVASQAGNGSYNAAPAVEHKIVVGKTSAEISLSGLSHTYDGSTKKVTVTTKPSDLSVTVTYDGSKDAPTNAGSYSVVATVNDENYEASQTSNTLIVAQADATIKVGGYEGTYDGKAHGATGSAKGVDGEDLSSLLSLGDKFTNVPGGTANWSLAGNGNYKAASGSVDIKINKTKATVDVSGYEGVYDGEAHGATGSAKGINGETLTLNLGSSFTNVPGGTANWSFDGDGNYEETKGSVEIKISRAKATVDVKGYEGTYDGNPHGATGSAKGVKGEPLTFNLGDSFTNVPGGTANWSFDGDGNYEKASGSVEVKIAQADAIISVTGGTHTYDGKAKGATGTARGVDGKDLSNLLNLGSSFINVPGGTANWSFAGDDNHKSTNGSADTVINKADQAISWSNPSVITYGTALGSNQLNASLTRGDGTLTYSPVEGTVLNAGTHTLKVEAGETPNYKAASASVELEVNKAQATVSLSNLSYVFDGSAKSATVATNPSGLSVTTTYNGSSSAPSAVGSYSVNATISDQNYQGSASGTLTISAWKLQGFYSPVDMGGTLNNAKAGSTVPLKFEVFAGSTELTSTSVISTFTQKLSCTTTTSDDIEQYATGSTSLRYDTTAGQFIFNWQTPKAAGSCYRVTMTTQDGSSISADFRLK